jgi:prepilin-type N-terminal cleavage/methylation domain-containing protein
MIHNSNNLHSRPTRAFTLIEILVTVAIILILIAILVAVGSNVRRTAQISATRAELQGLAGLIEQFEKDNHQTPPTTIYLNTDANTGINQKGPTVGTQPNFVDVLFLYPGTKNALVQLAGDKLKQIPGSTPPSYYIADSFGKPISFIHQGDTISTYVSPSDWPAADRDLLRSSGPDQTTDWTTSNSKSNLDDVLSNEAAH